MEKFENIQDFGPIYAETGKEGFLIEPFNTASNLIFLFLIIYWFLQVKDKWKEHPLIIVSLPILTIGFLGGSIYHATRSHNIWLFLDFMPIMILCLLAMLRFWLI